MIKMPLESGLYKFELSASPTVNKVGSTEFKLSPTKGASFYIEKLWIAVPDLDAIVATDQIAFQISTKDQNGADALYDIESEYEIATEFIDFHLAEGSLTTLKDPTKEFELVNFRGVQLPKAFYFNHLITGQDGAIGCYIKIKGNYSSVVLDSDAHNREL
jgi:hypothetical protein